MDNPTALYTQRVICGDCRKVLATLPDCSVDSIVTDPPYELGFMGKKWDSSGISCDPLVWEQALRVLKPGGYLLAFGGTRTYHRMACAIEDAGFEIRDQIQWMYGSGFPKSLDVSKAIDKMAGAERLVVSEGKPVKRMIPGADQDASGSWIKDNGREFVPSITEATTAEAKQWDGWGTALKPAHEPICVARKPFPGTVAQNVLQHGTGALNIDGCRIASTSRPLRVGDYKDTAANAWTGRQDGTLKGGSKADGETDLGRWPANVILDEEAGGVLDQQSGELQSGSRTGRRTQPKTKNTFGAFEPQNEAPSVGDSGGASRFFYCAKASQEERHINGQNDHPTVKPIALMRYLVRLVTPPGGTVLDMFAGSGTTGIAAREEGFGCILIELMPEHVAIIEKRLALGGLFA